MKADNISLTNEQLSILDHTTHRAPRGMFCGGGKDMDFLVSIGLMKSAGRVSWCPDEYFCITTKGAEVLRNSKKR